MGFCNRTSSLLPSNRFLAVKPAKLLSGTGENRKKRPVDNEEKCPTTAGYPQGNERAGINLCRAF